MTKVYHGGDLIKNFIPNDISRQVSSVYFTNKILDKNDIEIVLDLGCGKGDSIDYFIGKNPRLKWFGIDIESSPEKRDRKGPQFIAYDGVNVPFDKDFFDLIYCHQVFEHVENPKKLIREIERILRPGGYFVGSTSHLEPFHSLSIWNFTPYGFNLLLKDTSLKLIEVRPGIDVFTLILNRLFGRIPVISKFLSRYFSIESPLNFLIEMICRVLGKSRQDIILVKLLISGHFRFMVQKEKKR